MATNDQIDALVPGLRDIREAGFAGQEGTNVSTSPSTPSGATDAQRAKYNEHNSPEAQSWPAEKQCQCKDCAIVRASK